MNTISHIPTLWGISVMLSCILFPLYFGMNKCPAELDAEAQADKAE